MKISNKQNAIIMLNCWKSGSNLLGWNLPTYVINLSVLSQYSALPTYVINLSVLSQYSAAFESW